MTTVGLERVKVKGGRARSTRRKGRRREAGLALLRKDIEAATARTAQALGAELDGGLRAALESPEVPTGVAALLPSDEECARTHEGEVAAAIGQWCTSADQMVPKAGSPARVGAVKAFGPAGLATLHLAAAAGIADAERVLVRVLPKEYEEQVKQLRDALAERIEAVIGAEFDTVLTALRRPALYADAASGLRVRLAELRRLT